MNIKRSYGALFLFPRPLKVKLFVIILPKVSCKSLFPLSLVFLHRKKTNKKMKKTAILYWGKGGNAEHAAQVIYRQFDPESTDIFALDTFDVNNIGNYDLIILGGSTVGAENWEETSNDNRWNNFFRTIEGKDLSQVTFAAFGLGNQVLYPAHFVDGLGFFHEEMAKTNAKKIIGQWPVEGYNFTDSKGAHDGHFYGLALDEDNESEKTEERVKAWVAGLKKEMGL
jgi:flavodoxin I